jgi:MYXO-CTERM domain-containing protein
VATPSTTSGRTRVNLGQASSGCAVGAPGGRAADPGLLAAALAAALGLALTRRRRSR